MNKTLKKLGFLLGAGVSVLSLSACNTTPPAEPVVFATPVNKAEKQKLFSYLLNEQGIDIIKMGETYTIVIAGDQLFPGGSSNLDEKYANNLKYVAQLINSYDTTNVAVDVYTDKGGEIARALTEKQAQAVVLVMTADGIDARLIYAKGHGSLYPITSNPEEKNLNRRIEIKFQFHPEERV